MAETRTALVEADRRADAVARILAAMADHRVDVDDSLVSSLARLARRGAMWAARAREWGEAS